MDDARDTRSEGRGRRPISPVATAALALVLVAAATAALGGLGSRWGWWHFRTGFSLLRWGVYGAIAAAALGAVGMAHARFSAKRRGAWTGVAALAIGLAVAFVPWNWQRTARSVPPIHDISTDLEDPPEFESVVPLRGEDANPLERGAEVDEQQRRGYPDLGPLVLDRPVPEIFDLAVEAAEEMGWELVAAEPDEGRIEAVATTFWFGFRDDVVVRVRPAEGGGSRVDVRSVSRVGRSDVGTNARRIRSYFDELRAVAGAGD